MNKQNLIRLGSECQIKFSMQEGYNIIEIPPDYTHNVYKVPIPEIIGWTQQPRVDFSHIEIEEIVLEKLGFINNYEYIMVGYGRKSNTLIIKEYERNYK